VVVTMWPSATMQNGKEYAVDITITNYVGGIVTVYFGSLLTVQLPAANGVYGVSGISGGDNVLYIQASLDFDGKVSAIYASLADPDRSINDNPLSVNGTVTKTAVATNAELIAYSGFSDTNYLEQAYNADLDFGTDDFYTMGWLNPIDTGTILYNGSWQAGTFAITFKTSTGLEFSVYGSGILTAPSVISGSGNTFFCYRRIGGNAQVFINGVLEASVSQAGIIGTGSPLVGSPLVIGITSDITSPLGTGSLSLLRIGAGAPTAEQIKEIYDSEKPLFNENAKCTLQGASSDIKALDFDKSTNILTVCSADHTTKFNGLVVVDDDNEIATSVSTVCGKEAFGK